MLKNIAQSLYRNVMDEVGVPASLTDVVKSHPSLRMTAFKEKQTASSRDIQRWEDFGMSSRGLDAERGVLLGWADAAGDYASFELPVPALRRLVTTQRVEQFACDITEIETLAAAKSNLSDFENLDEFAEKRCANLLVDISKVGLLKLLEHDQIRSLGANATDTLSRYGWDGRLNLLNEGGAHHFAAARYIAKRTGIPVSISTALHEHMLDPSALAELTSQFDIFAIGDPEHDPRPYSALQDAFRKFRATFFIGALPWSPENHEREAKALFLPKNDRKCQRISEVFRKEGFIDIGLVLQNQLALQMSAHKAPIRKSHQPPEPEM